MRQSHCLARIYSEGALGFRARTRRHFANSRRSGQRLKEVAPLLKELILAACNELLHWKADAGGHHLSALALDEIRRATAVPLAIVLPRDNRLRRAVALMTDHKGRLWRLEDLATQVGASSRTLARHFKAETGLTFRQWRQHAQIAEAMGALTTGTSPARAAARVDGWQSEQ